MKLKEYLHSGVLAAAAASGFLSASYNFQQAYEYHKLAEEAMLDNDKLSAKLLEIEHKDAQEKGNFGALVGIAFGAFAVISFPRRNKIETMMADYR